MDLYYHPASPPCLTVMMVGKALGVDFNLKFIDLFKNEQNSAEFVKINPQHCVPVLIDNGFKLTESRAIIVYLQDKFGKNDSLYPKEAQARGLVNQFIQFDIGTLYQRFVDFYVGKYEKNVTDTAPLIEGLEKAIGIFDVYLESKKFIAGDTPTLADYTLFMSVHCYELSKIDVTKYPNVNKWFEMCKVQMPFALSIDSGVEEIRKYMP